MAKSTPSPSATDAAPEADFKSLKSLPSLLAPFEVQLANDAEANFYLKRLDRLPELAERREKLTDVKERTRASFDPQQRASYTLERQFCNGRCAEVEREIDAPPKGIACQRTYTPEQVRHQILVQLRRIAVSRGWLKPHASLDD